MRAAYEAFRDGSGAAAIAAAGGGDPEAGPSFYASLYVGLYHEAHGEADAAKEAMLRCACGADGSAVGPGGKGGGCNLRGQGVALVWFLLACRCCLVCGCPDVSGLSATEQSCNQHPRAVKTRYARMSGDYMADLARIHCLRRGWEVWKF